MQVLKQEYFDKRVLHYASNAYHPQPGTRDTYHELNPVIFLGILNFEFTSDSHWISTHRVHDLATREHGFRDIDFTFVELPKFTKSESELTTVADKWIYFLKNAQDLRAVPAVVHEQAVKEAFEIVYRVTWTQQQLDVYEHRKMTRMDEAARLSLSHKEGQKDMVMKFIQAGASKELVQQATGLSMEEIEQLLT